MEKEVGYLKAWIVNFIMALVGALVGGLVIGFVIGFVGALLGFDRDSISIMGVIVGAFIELYSSFFFYKWSIKKFIIPQVS